jgi:hypothetical protein
MTDNIKVTFDESALGRLYLWLLSLDNETPAVGKLDIDKIPEVDLIEAVPIPSEEMHPNTIDSDSKGDTMV